MAGTTTKYEGVGTVLTLTMWESFPLNKYMYIVVTYYNALGTYIEVVYL